MTVGPLESSCVTLLVTASVPSAQLVLVTVPAVESMVVVPAAVQLQLGAVAKLPDHCVTSTLTDGGRTFAVASQAFPGFPSQSRVPPPQAAHEPLVQVWDVEQVAVEHVVPQLVSWLMCFSQPFNADESHSSVPVPQETQAPPLHVSVFGAQPTALPHCPLDEHVSTQTPVHAFATHADATHVAGVPHCPLDVQVAMPLFMQVLSPGAQTPVHAPLTHAWPVQVTPFCQVPVPSQL
jgi:hypothetical protein